MFHGDAHVWSGMFLLGLLLPGVGTYATGVILKEASLQRCGLTGSLIGLFFLRDFCNSSTISPSWCLGMAVAMVISLVIPGHILNAKADFVYLKEKTESTAGNLSVQLDKLASAGYITKETDGSGAKARTICKMTDAGRMAMQNYVAALKSYFTGLNA